MNKTAYATLAAALVLSVSGAASAQTTCTTTSAFDAQVLNDLGAAIGGGGSYDLQGTTTCPAALNGQDGADGRDGTDGVAGADGRDGRDGVDGVNGLNGRDFQLDKALALSAAISTPVWLGDSENFAISGGVGFASGETAFGATGIMRLDKHWSAFAGGAVGSGDWVGRAGARVGW